MSKRSISLLLIMAGLLALPFASSGAPRSPVMLLPHELARMGLVQQWRTHVLVDGTRGGIASISPHVSSGRFHSVFEVHSGTGDSADVQRFSENQFGYQGRVDGRAEAKRQADIAARVLKSLGMESSVTERKIPEVTLQVATTRGMVQILNAATGSTIWSALIGKPGYPVFAPQISDKYIAAINGSTLYLLNRDTTKIELQRRLSGLPSSHPAINDTHVFVPMRGDSVEVFDFSEPGHRPSTRLASLGSCVGPPMVTADTVSWGTETGFVYVTKTDNFRSQFRFETGSSIVHGVSQGTGDAILVSTEDGHVYSFSARTGVIYWFYFSGEEFADKPLVIGDVVYALTHDAGLMRLQAENGLLDWHSPSVKRVLSASANRLYVLDHADRLSVLDATTGQRLASISARGLDFFLQNGVTDRLYVGTQSGQLLCLRQRDLVWPEIHLFPPSDGQDESDQEASDAGSSQTENGDSRASEDEPSADDADPFSEDEDDDPFSEDGGDDPFASEDGEDSFDDEDPFDAGGDEEPIDDSDDEDPFGESDDEEPIDAGGDEEPFGESDDEEPLGGGEDADPSESADRGSPSESLPLRLVGHRDPHTSLPSI